MWFPGSGGHPQTSTHRDRIEENAVLWTFALSDEDMAVLDTLDRTGATDAAREQKWW